jgi:hypothetical protein
MEDHGWDVHRPPCFQHMRVVGRIEGKIMTNPQAPIVEVVETKGL